MCIYDWRYTEERLCSTTGHEFYAKFVDAGFKLKEIVIKEQHNCRSTDYWEGKERKFLMLAHEYILYWRKQTIIILFEKK